MSDMSSLSSSPVSLFSSNSPFSSSSRCTPPSLQGNNVADLTAMWLVQKYGGTSIGKFAVKIAEDIIPEHLCKHKVAVVCSARSGSTKSAGTTNLLLRAAEQANRRPTYPSTVHVTADQDSRVKSLTSPPSDESCASKWPVVSHIGGDMASHSLVEVVREEHLTAARASIGDAIILHRLKTEINGDCDELKSYLSAAQVINEISPRSRDYIVAFGERLSGRIMTAVLRDRGIDAEFVNLEDIVPLTEGGEDFHDTEALAADFYDRVATAVGERIKQCGTRVPVVTGFFGPVPGSLLQQIGRGYTDLLAALLAVGVGASELQIWKEVDGIFTADPHKVPTARLIPIITPEEAAELTHYGSEVVHPFTMEQTTQKNIPIRIKNVENPRGLGTVIRSDEDDDGTGSISVCDKVFPSASCPSIVLCSRLPYNPFSCPLLPSSQDASRRLPTAVTVKERIVVLNVHCKRKSVSCGFLARVFGTLDRYGVVVDLITTSEVHVSMAIEECLSRRVLDCIVRELQKSGTVTVIHDMAILSLVGKRMRHMVGIAGRMLTTLGQRGVNVEMISQGTNEINISCVINGRDTIKALNLVHQSCLQIRSLDCKV